jgi:hypothetical protein
MLSARFKVSIKGEYKEFGYLIEVDVELFDMHLKKNGYFSLKKLR